MTVIHNLYDGIDKETKTYTTISGRWQQANSPMTIFKGKKKNALCNKLRKK